MNYTTLAAEIAKPAYDGLDNDAIAAALNTADKTAEVETLQPQTVFAAMGPSEVEALTNAQSILLWGILGMGLVYLKDPNTRTALASMFPGGSVTRQALISLQTETVSQATILGLGTIKPGHVAKAKALGGI